MKYFILPLCLLFITSTQAQNSKLPIYLRGDWGLSNVKTSNGKGKVWFASAIGAETFIKIKELKEMNISFSPNVSYFHTTYKPDAGGDVRVNYFFVGLPIGVAISEDPKEDVGMYLGVGPYVGLATSGKYRSYSIDPFTKIKFGNKVEDNRKSTDAGVMLKAAIRFQKFYLGIQRNMGTSNLIPKDRIIDGAFIRSRSLMFYLSYKIN